MTDSSLTSPLWAMAQSKFSPPILNFLPGTDKSKLRKWNSRVVWSLPRLARRQHVAYRNRILWYSRRSVFVWAVLAHDYRRPGHCQDSKWGSTVVCHSVRRGYCLHWFVLLFINFQTWNIYLTVISTHRLPLRPPPPPWRHHALQSPHRHYRICRDRQRIKPARPVRNDVSHGGRDVRKRTMHSGVEFKQLSRPLQTRHDIGHAACHCQLRWFRVYVYLPVERRAAVSSRTLCYSRIVVLFLVLVCFPFSPCLKKFWLLTSRAGFCAMCFIAARSTRTKPVENTTNILAIMTTETRTLSLSCRKNFWQYTLFISGHILLDV